MGNFRKQGAKIRQNTVIWLNIVVLQLPREAKISQVTAMLKHDFLRRSLVLLFAGTGILVLLAQWRTVASTTATDVNSLLPPSLAPAPPPAAVNGLHLRVDLSDRRVSLYRSDRKLASYPIAVGQRGWETPLGAYQVIEMQRYPVWRHPLTNEIVPQGRDNPLGSRWIGFWDDGRHHIGFHGTPEAKLVGQPVSHGCLRMRNADIQALYEQVSPGTPVIVQD